MPFSILHMIVTALVLFVAIYVLERTSLLQNASRPKRAIIFGVVVFVVMLILNLVWPSTGVAP